MRKQTIDIVFFLLLIGMLSLFPMVTTLAAEILQYSYDKTDQLKTIQYNNGTTVDYVYDNLGNRLQKSTNVGGAPANSAPTAVTSPSPASSATNIPLVTTLSWSAATDPDAGDEIIYYIYLGKSNNPELVGSTRNTSFTTPPLDMQTTFHWKVVARDSHNAETASNTWTFRTINNTPPTAGIKASVTEGIVPFATVLNDASTSTDDRIIKYQWDISDDGTVDFTVPHIYYTMQTENDVPVRLTVTDGHGATDSTLITLYSRPDSDGDGLYDSIDNCPRRLSENIPAS